MRTLFKGGTVVSGVGTREADLVTDGEKIAAIEKRYKGAFDLAVNVRGCLLFPGFIDAHTRFDADVDGATTADNFYTGSKAALCGGVTTDRIFDFVKALRRDVKVPMVFMTYSNVVFSYGADRFISNCHEIGIDGLILPDLPFEEKDEFLPLCKQYGVDLISLIAPTSENRIAKIAKEAEGFLYLVSSLGVTGTRTEITTDLASIVKVVRENTDIPCAIGFGISTPEQAAKMAGLSDGAIVGSAIIKLLEKYGKDAPTYVGAYVKSMKAAMR